MFCAPPFAVLTGTVAVYVFAPSVPSVGVSVIELPATPAASQPVGPGPYTIVPIEIVPRSLTIPAPVLVTFTLCGIGLTVPTVAANAIDAGDSVSTGCPTVNVTLIA